MTRLALLLFVLLAAGCAGTRTVRDKPASPARAETASTVPKPAWSPLSEVGLRGEEIPPVLLQALATPYARPEPLNCANLSAAITELDAVLGADLDNAPAIETSDSFALYAVTSGIRGLIPYYGWIRRLSGADRQQRRALAAVAAGNTRRGYLKGLGEARACALPARPNREARTP